MVKEMLHHAISSASDRESSSDTKLRAEDKSSAGDNLTFLRSKLVWETGEDGRERVMDEDSNGSVWCHWREWALMDEASVMMGWEEPLSEYIFASAHTSWWGEVNEHVRLTTADLPDAQPGGQSISILNIGYGLGIVHDLHRWGHVSWIRQIDRLFQYRLSSQPRPSHHTIIEAHPQVLEHMRAQGVYDWPGVRILEGRWQDWLLDPEKLIEVTAQTPEGMGFYTVFVDTFAEAYEGLSLSFFLRKGDWRRCVDLKAFFDVLPDILEPEHGTFSFWNGLGATSTSPHISHW